VDRGDGAGRPIADEIGTQSADRTPQARRCARDRDIAFAPDDVGALFTALERAWATPCTWLR